MCLECSGVHRSLGTHITQVRSLKLDTSCWTVDLVEFMQSVGNTKFNAEWEKYYTEEYVRPSEFPKLRIVREHFIRQKYADERFRKEPASDAQQCRPNSGWLVKLGGGFRPKWQRRWFVLHESSKKLSYFKSQGDSFPANTLQLTSESSVRICHTSAYNKPHCFALSPSGVEGSREYVCQCEDGKELMRWVQHLRYVVKCLPDAGATGMAEDGGAAIEPGSPASPAPGSAAALLLQRGSQLCREQVIFHQGWLSKRGGRWHSWNKRWVVLTRAANLFYFKKQHDGAAAGMLSIKGSQVTKISKGESGYKPHALCIKTEERNFFLVAISDSERDMWIEKISEVAERI